MGQIFEAIVGNIQNKFLRIGNAHQAKRDYKHITNQTKLDEVKYVNYYIQS